MTPSPVIEIDTVRHAYGDTTVLEGVSLSVDRGELVGLVGPNGAGKSTLLRTVSGAIDPDGGTVSLDGTSVAALGSKATSRRVAVVPQSTSVSFSFPVRDLVAMGRHPYNNRFDRGPPDHSPVDRAMERTDVVQFEDREIDELSGGERQRVILARAIAQETPGLLLDEPTNNLDINHQIETFETVRSLIDSGKAGLAAIHDLELAARYCDRIALLSNGQFEAVGPPADVLTSERIGRTFGTGVAVRPNPLTSGVSVSAYHVGEKRDESVHVLGYGRSAAELVAKLTETGVTVTAGPVPAGDQVIDIAESVGASVIESEPYDAIEPRTLSHAQECISSATLTVVAVDGYSSGLDPVLDVAKRTTTVLPVTSEAATSPDGQLQQLGDPVEADRLERALSQDRTPQQSVTVTDE